VSKIIWTVCEPGPEPTPIEPCPKGGPSAHEWTLVCDDGWHLTNHGECDPCQEYIDWLDPADFGAHFDVTLTHQVDGDAGTGYEWVGWIVEPT
jgi:hypothetical protein